jgi:5-methylcytosine-specific restriction enzyme subunit McrC
MTNDKGILIKNIYYMLAYAFQVLKQNNYEKIEAEEFENVFDMLAAILNKGISRQLKQGLYREYVSEQDNLAALRGKVDINGSIRNKMARKRVMACEYDELSEDNILNQILKTVSLILLRQTGISEENKKQIRKNMLFFSNVTEIESGTINWSSIRYQRNNQNYRMLINICYLILDSLLLSTETGECKLPSFLDEQKMCRLYEKFILEYYRYHHPELNANPTQIPWDVDDGMVEFLPIMQTDITLKYKGKILIIDAKYYAHTMQQQYDAHTLHSNNLYQIFTYVKNMDKKNTGDVSGMLLYAKTQEQITPDNKFMMSGNKVTVKTLDLNGKFGMICQELDEIAKDIL